MKLIPLRTASKAAYLKGKKIHNPPLPRPRWEYRVEGLTKAKDEQTGEPCSGDAYRIGTYYTEQAAKHAALLEAPKHYEIQILALDEDAELKAHWYVKVGADGQCRFNKIL
jgi:hypothetical protein